MSYKLEYSWDDVKIEEQVFETESETKSMMYNALHNDGWIKSLKVV